jgi:hypothetical protein
MRHDFLDRETIVIDDPDDRPSRRRVGEELTMQVYVESAWHRRTPDLKTTACGEAFHSQFAKVRPESHAGVLCRICFTDYELALNERINEREYESIVPHSNGKPPGDKP